MAEILLSTLTRGKNAQHVLLMTKVLETLTEETARTYGFLSQWTNFSFYAKKEIDYFYPDRSFTQTDMIAYRNRKRLNVYYLYKEIADAYTKYAGDDEKKQAGMKVLGVLKKDKALSEYDYQEKTSVFTDLVTDLRKEDILAELTKLRIENAPDELEAANKEFDAIYSNRSLDLLDRKTNRMKYLRKDANEALIELIKAINVVSAHNELITNDEETTEDLDEIIQNINAYLLQYRVAATGKSRVSKNKTEKPETPEEPAEEEEPEEEEGTGAVPHP